MIFQIIIQNYKEEDEIHRLIDSFIHSFNIQTDNI
jgi:hypothetical protein